MEIFFYMVIAFWAVFGGIVIFTKYESGEFFTIQPDRLNLTMFVYGPIGWVILGKMRFDKWMEIRISNKTLDERLRIKKFLAERKVTSLDEYRKQFK